jgi:hypothetical protein
VKVSDSTDTSLAPEQHTADLRESASISQRVTRFRSFVHGWVRQAVDVHRALGAWRYTTFIRDWYRYSRLEGAEPIRLLNTFPCLHDATEYTELDPQYFFQDIWAFRRIYETRPAAHIDVASRIGFAGMISAITHVIFIDIRPLLVDLKGFESRKGSILNLPFSAESIGSLSCLHVAEHVGLGRYGDPLDPYGTRKAASELRRVLARGGNLFFSLPVGKPRLCFNAQRVHSPKQILEYFEGLDLLEFSAIDDEGRFQEYAKPADFEGSWFSCGLFWFTRPK